MLCPTCGNTVSDRARFCPRCGNPISGAPSQPSQALVPQNDPFAQPTMGGQPSYAQPNPYEQPYTPPQNPYETPYTPPQPQPGVREVPGSGGPRRAIKNDRSLVTVILLSIVTCGFYGFWLIYTIAQDVNDMFDDDEATGGLGIYLLLSFVTCGFYAWYWEYKVANRIAKNAPLYGVAITETGNDILLWNIVGILFCGLGPWVAWNIIIKNMNQVANAYNARYGLTYTA